MSGNDHIVVSCGIILLAAGTSARLGKPKQLLLYKGETLLQHGVQMATATGSQPVIVVLGANADLVRMAIKDKGIQIIINNDWEEGMASSIRCGLKKLLEMAPQVEAAIYMVCDQPFVTTQLLKDLVENYEVTRKPIIASGYGNSIGTPALFDKSLFTALLELKGDHGAKTIMKEDPGRVKVVNFPLGNIDIDTVSDYAALPDNPA